MDEKGQGEQGQRLTNHQARLTSESGHRKEENREGGYFGVPGRLAQRGHGGIPKLHLLIRGVQGLQDKLMLKLDWSNVHEAVVQQGRGTSGLGDVVQV